MFYVLYCWHLTVRGLLWIDYLGRDLQLQADGTFIFFGLLVTSDFNYITLMLPEHLLLESICQNIKVNIF